MERILYKINSAKTAVKFNEICLKEGLLPKYSKLRLHDPFAIKEMKTLDFRRSLVCRQLELKKKEISERSSELHSLTQEWKIISSNQEAQKQILEALHHMKKEDYVKKE